MVSKESKRITQDLSQVQKSVLGYSEEEMKFDDKSTIYWILGVIASMAAAAITIYFYDVTP